ncbi:MAG: hypothetical protein FWC67_00570 [Defluviitaleaceae bacterium]|nr:hypothetical protein [Defluviitaleaceae bacterium]
MTISKELFALLQEIRKVPGIYLGVGASLTAIRHFINGYSSKERKIGEGQDIVIDLREFMKYLTGFYELDKKTLFCFDLIKQNTKNDEEAFYKFFELLDEYLESKNGAPDIQLD